jgi:hypothetical protein
MLKENIEKVKRVEKGEPIVHISSNLHVQHGLHLHTMSTQSVETISRTARVDILATCHLGTPCCSRAVVFLLSRVHCGISAFQKSSARKKTLEKEDLM